MYNKVDTNMNLFEREKKTEQYWRENNIYRKTIVNRKQAQTLFRSITRSRSRKQSRSGCRL